MKIKKPIAKLKPGEKILGKTKAESKKLIKRKRR